MKISNFSHLLIACSAVCMDTKARELVSYAEKNFRAQRQELMLSYCKRCIEASTDRADAIKQVCTDIFESIKQNATNTSKCIESIDKWDSALYTAQSIIDVLTEDPDIDQELTQRFYVQMHQAFDNKAHVYKYIENIATTEAEKVDMRNNIAKVFDQKAQVMYDAAAHQVNRIILFKIQSAKVQSANVSDDVIKEIFKSVKNLIAIQQLISNSWLVVKEHASDDSERQRANQHMARALNNAIYASYCYNLSKGPNLLKAWEELASIAEEGKLIGVVGDEYQAENCLELCKQLQDAIQDLRELSATWFNLNLDIKRLQMLKAKLRYKVSTDA